MSEYIQVLTDAEAYRKENGQLVERSRHEAFAKETPGYNLLEPYPAVWAIFTTPGGGQQAFVVLTPEWWEHILAINSPEVRDAIRELGINPCILGRGDNRDRWGENSGGDGKVPLNPEDWGGKGPVWVVVVTTGDVLKKIGQKGKAAKIDTFRLSDTPPDPATVDWRTNPRYVRASSVAVDGSLGLAPRGMEFIYPLITKDGKAYLPLEQTKPVSKPTTPQEEPIVTDPKALLAHGADISEHQGRYTHKKPLDFIIIEASRGLARIPEMPALLAQAAPVPIKGTWHYDYTRFDWKAQADSHLAAIEGHGYSFTAWDLETIGNPPLTMQNWDDARKAVKYIEEHGRMPCFLYSSLATMAAAHKLGAKWIITDDEIKLWVARWFSTGHYSKPTAVGPYSSVRPNWATAAFWNAAKWSLWQYGGDRVPAGVSWTIPGKNQGPEYGVLSASIELDLYNGTVEAMRADLGIPDAPPDDEPDEPPPVLTMEERVGRLEAAWMEKFGRL